MVLYRVMLVDDEDIVRIQLNRSLDWNKMGFEIALEAENGADAIEMLGNSSIDLVITDIKMPKIDGIELLRYLKEKRLCSCIVFLSGYSDFEFAQQGLVLGAFDYILKPVDTSILENVLIRVKHHLEEKKPDKVLDFYYLNEKEGLLTQCVSAGDEKTLQVAEDLFKEIKTVLSEDYDKMGSILNHIIENILKEVTEKNHVLKNIINYKSIANTELLTIRDSYRMKKVFILKISEILGVISNLKLNQKNNIINKVCEYVLQNVDEDLTLKSISDKFFISKNYLSFLFKQETGENFLDYLTKVKMERAKFLLKEDNYKAYEISNLLGYSESTYFSKLFKKHTGYTPTEYRKNVF